jgi:hypothetical protein
MQSRTRAPALRAFAHACVLHSRASIPLFSFLQPPQEWDEDGEEEAPPGSAAAFWADATPHVEDPTLPWSLTPLLSIEKLGRIEYIRPAYHAPRALYPIGYSATRRAGPEAGGRLWRCEILDGGDAPLFRVTAVAAGDKAAKMATATAAAVVYEGAHPTAAWYAAMAGEAGGSGGGGGALAGAAGASGAAAPRRADAKRAAPGEEPSGAAGGKQRGAASGGEMFGLTHKRVAAALQRLPDAPRCDKYQARVCRSAAVACERAQKGSREAQVSLRVASRAC